MALTVVPQPRVSPPLFPWTLGGGGKGARPQGQFPDVRPVCEDFVRSVADWGAGGRRFMSDQHGTQCGVRVWQTMIN